ncbi:hypothetical protein SODALDRAFT_358275 [Sodiomyces alkalinus F11]|uniref:Uncharacterized protein n=1 Tax=Sodiomyces alkalinus (strain CBS 110278 / VKM F-3762 / F11) TaxID=1314773 RepID=A0A3N2PZA8_SODAK|nr:hypothetical protein SODALDRAFT_358275 [Sodiomyces alkalinus F11]ROT39861.1 hypothetical protein SODALDRAFT_358275 [Sodiomyces alkalinus F11]
MEPCSAAMRGPRKMPYPCVSPPLAREFPASSKFAGYHHPSSVESMVSDASESTVTFSSDDHASLWLFKRTAALTPILRNLNVGRITSKFFYLEWTSDTRLATIIGTSATAVSTPKTLILGNQIGVILTATLIQVVVAAGNTELVGVRTSFGSGWGRQIVNVKGQVQPPVGLGNDLFLPVLTASEIIKLIVGTDPSMQKGGSDSPSQTFEKRPRHKTREDKYDRERKPRGTRKHSESSKPGKPKRRKEVAKKQLASRREVMNNFTSQTVRSDRVTLHPGATPGIFQNGHFSSNNHTEDLAHVGMDWTPQVNHHQNVTRRSSKSRDREKRRRERELEDMNAYFRPRSVSRLERGRTRHTNPGSDASDDATQQSPKICRRSVSTYSQATSYHCRSLSQPSRDRRQGKHGSGVSPPRRSGDLYDVGQDLQNTGVSKDGFSLQHQRGRSRRPSSHLIPSPVLNSAGDTNQKLVTSRPPPIIRYVDKGVTATVESIDCCKVTGDGPAIEYDALPSLSCSGPDATSNCLPGPSVPPETNERDDATQTRSIQLSNQQSTTEEALVREAIARRAYMETPGNKGVPAPSSSLDPVRIQLAPTDNHTGEAAERIVDVGYTPWSNRASSIQRFRPPEGQHIQYSCAANRDENSLATSATAMAGTASVHVSVAGQHPSTPRPTSANGTTNLKLTSVEDLAIRNPMGRWVPEDSRMMCTERPELRLSREFLDSGHMYTSAGQGTDNDISRLDREVFHEHVLRRRRGFPEWDIVPNYGRHSPPLFMQNRIPSEETYETETYDHPLHGEADKRQMFLSQAELEVSADASLRRHGLRPLGSLNSDDRGLGMATFWGANSLI